MDRKIVTEMINRENVIKGLQIERECVSRNCDRDCGKCDLVQDRDWLLSVYDDALALLEEQETEWEHLWDAPDGTFKGRCKKCGFVHIFIEGHDTQYKFCPECGKAVKWK